jgi:hypothetical protein
VGPQVDGTQCPPMFRANMDDPIHMSNLPPQQMKLMTSQMGMNSTTKQNLDKKWATFFYEVNNPFNVAYHPTFIDAMKSTSDCKILYKLMSHHVIQT